MEVDHVIKQAERTLRSTLRSAQQTRRQMANAIRHTSNLSNDAKDKVSLEDRALSRIEAYITNAFSSLPDEPDLRVRALQCHLESVAVLAA
jgi:uncharacterized protein YlxW (UPF0749 family)